MKEDVKEYVQLVHFKDDRNICPECMKTYPKLRLPLLTICVDCPNEETRRKNREFMDSEHDCKCMNSSFEDFDKCCGKKFGIQNPIEILFNMVKQESKKSKVKRLKDMEPEEATKTLEKVFKVLEGP